jgi:hypothetical protein
VTFTRRVVPVGVPEMPLTTKVMRICCFLGAAFWARMVVTVPKFFVFLPWSMYVSAELGERNGAVGVRR